MSIGKSEKFVAVTTTYALIDCSGPNSDRYSYLAISGLGDELYTVAHKTPVCMPLQEQ